MKTCQSEQAGGREQGQTDNGRERLKKVNQLHKHTEMRCAVNIETAKWIQKERLWEADVIGTWINVCIRSQGL